MSSMCHYYLQLPADNSKLNMTHTIHSVHFGPHFPGQVNPLDGERIATEGTTLLGLCAVHTVTAAEWTALPCIHADRTWACCRVHQACG